MQKNGKAITLTVMAFLIAMEIVLTRYVSINLPIARIGFGFLPVAMMGIMYGPLWAGAGYALGDILGMLLAPSGPYFPGFTLTAFLTGAVYGIFFYKKERSMKSIATACIIVTFVLNLVLDTLWLHILMGQGVLALLPARLIKVSLMCLIQIIVIPFIWKFVICRLPAGIYHSGQKSTRPACH